MHLDKKSVKAVEFGEDIPPVFCFTYVCQEQAFFEYPSELGKILTKQTLSVAAMT
jgi:hypothetical protein